MEIIQTKSGHQYVYEQRTGFLSLAHGSGNSETDASTDSSEKI